MSSIKIFVQKTDNGKDLPLPSFMTPGAAGADLFAAINNTMVLKPGKYLAVPTGIRISLPEKHEAQIRPRSGIAAKYGVTLLNSPGTVDSDYRGEIIVLLINLGEKDFIISRGDRIAQMIIHKCPDVFFEEITKLPETKRGSGGFGHTGIR